MPDSPTRTRFLFPRWANYALPAIAAAVVGGFFYMPTLFLVGASPKTTAVGYMPDQPVPYSHAIHVGKLGMDCRYCHSTVEKAAFASIPPTQVCMNCHSTVRANSPLLEPVRASWQSGMPVDWVKVHDLPDYAYFNHSAHVNRGVGCASCHGRIDQMDKVYQVAPLSMGWCLDCHRAPELHLRPKNQVTNMAYTPVEYLKQRGQNVNDPDEAQKVVGLEIKQKYGIRDTAYMTSCYTCHR